VKRPSGSPPAFKARYFARGFSQRRGRDYELHSLDFSTAFLQGNLHEGIWQRRPPSFTGSFPAGTQWSLRRLVYGLCQAPREWYDTLRTTLAALKFAPSTADPSLFLRTDTSLLSFYVLVYVNDLLFATADTEALTLVLQRFGFQFSSPQPTPLSTRHSISAPPSDESVEPNGLYPERVGCLMYLMTCTRPDLAYPLSLFARYVATDRHQKVHWDAAKRVLHYLCSTSGMGLVLGGRGPVVLTGHADASWADDSATQRSSQGYTFSLGSGSVSWRSTRSSSVLSSCCEAEIYEGAMAAQELRWLTYLQTDFGEQPRSPPILTKDITLRFFLARELQQRDQLRLAYVATRANTADIFIKALPPGDHQRFSTVLGLLALLFLTDLLDKSVIVYLDDILIFSRTRKQHLRDLDAVFKRLQENQVITKGSKCDFFKRELEFFGYVISHDGIKSDPAKIKTIQESFVWGKEAEVAFQELKDFIVSPQVLRFADPSKPFEVNPDASDFAIGFVLL
ncbi:unnamed protein product, partial [Closterium sp. NIES-53]